MSKEGYFVSRPFPESSEPREGMSTQEQNPEDSEAQDDEVPFSHEVGEEEADLDVAQELLGDDEGEDIYIPAPGFGVVEDRRVLISNRELDEDDETMNASFAQSVLGIEDVEG